MFWGQSAALDLFDEYLKAHKIKIKSNDNITTEEVHEGDTVSEDNNNDTTNPSHADFKDESHKISDTDTEENIKVPKCLNILLYGCGDPRHVIKTLAKRYAQCEMPELNIYMVDCCIEITARNILLLGIALESPESFNLVSKTHLFMDIYGNTLTRPTSHHYMVAKAKTLIKMITDDDELQRLAPLLNIELLRYSERDRLENAFNFWQPKPQHVYNIEDYWINRVRKLLATRYDYREGAFDWDLNMVLKDRGAQQICSQEYRYWRECGIAFVFPEYEQCKPNKSLAAGLTRNGQYYVHRGYVGDIQTGPFCAFGLRSKEQRMHCAQHGENDYRATDITERNLLELFHELQTGSEYVHDKELSRKYGSVKLLMGKRLICNEYDINVQQCYNKPWIGVPGVKLYFVSEVEALQMQENAPRWRNFFDIIFVGHNLFPLLRQNFGTVMRKNCLLLLETKLLTVERKENVQQFESKLLDYAKLIDFEPVINYKAINAQNMVLKFKKVVANTK